MISKFFISLVGGEKGGEITIWGGNFSPRTPLGLIPDVYVFVYIGVNFGNECLLLDLADSRSICGYTMSFLWPNQACTHVDEKFLSLRKKMKPCKKCFLDMKAIFLKLKYND